MRSRYYRFCFVCSQNGNICIRLITEDSAEALMVNGEQSYPFPILSFLNYVHWPTLSSSGIHEKGVHQPLSPVSGVTSHCSNSISAAPGWPGWAACKRGARLSFSAESRVASVNSKGLLICPPAYGQLPKKEVFNTLYLHYDQRHPPFPKASLPYPQAQLQLSARGV